MARGIHDTDVAQNQLRLQHEMVVFAKGLGQQPPRPPDFLIDPKNPTSNYIEQANSLGWSWCRAALGADHPETVRRRQGLLDELRQQRQEWMRAEQCAPEPHHGMHASAFAVALLFVMIYPDEELLRELLWWFGCYFAIAKAFSTATGEVIVPCCNSRGPRPTQKLWSVNWRAYLGLAHPGAPSEEVMRDPEQRYWTAHWALADERVKLSNIAIGEIPKMRCALTSERRPDGYIARIQRPTSGKVTEEWVCSAVAVGSGRLVGVEQSWSGKILPVTAG